ncbi:MAG: UDP-N-acetylmuramoyl-tripeptide--D-alanyl-D-alanine ligase [Gammaproteobacteria bacterium]|nr:UDP-N-acetylmuramoyl-tripeptide--D-alanyl-D-alanine ligase [Gammaproteobacteria bacterium]
MSSITYAIMFFFVLALAGYGCHTVWKIRKQLHMLQLNSYFNQRYLSWLYKKKSQVFNLKELEPLIALIGMFFYEPLVVLILFALIYFRLFLIRPNSPEKKPLVFTARATRLFVVSLAFLLIIYLGLFAVWWKYGDVWFAVSIGFLVFYNFFLPASLMLANILLQPVEKFIQYRYFHKAYRYLHTLSNLKVVGITGSFGKTTTKYVLTEILRHKFNTLKTPGSYNTTMGITKVINEELKPIHDVFVVEMSAKKPGDIKEICKLVEPQYGLITAIGEQHLETFKTLENIKKTKNELIESLPACGIAFFNLDDINSQELVGSAKCRVISYGIDAPKLDYRVLDLTLDEHGSSFKVVRSSDNSEAIFQVPLLGRPNIYNILGAIAVAGEMGMQLSEMVYPLRKVAAIPHRLQLRRIGGGIIFIDDAFNSNPVGSKMALEVLEQITGQRKIIVTPGMIELGTKEDEYNKVFGEHIATICDYAILVGKKQTLALQRGLQNKQYSKEKMFVATDFAAAKKHLESMLKSGDVVLFENDLPDNYGDTI